MTRSVPTGPAAVPAGLPSPPDLDADWPGVADPDVLRALVARWLAGYGSAGTRRTYAYALGLPAAWADAVVGAEPGPARTTRPPAAPRGPLHRLAWFRWCAARALDPRAATGTDVTAWLHALDAAGARPRTRARMLSTVAALYADLVEQGAVAGNPAALNRSRLGLSGTAREPSPTIRLTADQVRALLVAAAALPDRTRHAELYRRRAVAVVTLMALGLRVSEVTALDRDDVVLTGGERVLRVLGKGGRRREVYLPDPAARAVDAYLAAAGPDALPVHRGRPTAGAPLITRRDGTRCTRFGLYALLRRVARHAGPELDGVADRVHPHALRHAYVTIALEHDARIQHVQADVGHASVATTQHYDRGLRRRAASAADVVSDAIHGTDAIHGADRGSVADGRREAGSGPTPTEEKDQ